MEQKKLSWEGGKLFGSTKKEIVSSLLKLGYRDVRYSGKLREFYYKKK